MRTHDLYKEINVERQETDVNSVLSFYRRLLRLRKDHIDVFVYGTFDLLEPEDVSKFCFKKHYQEKTALVALNFTCVPQKAPTHEDMNLLVSSYSKTLPEVLQPYEGRVYINY
jgi:alpha-glucosidase